MPLRVGKEVQEVSRRWLGSIKIKYKLTWCSSPAHVLRRVSTLAASAVIFLNPAFNAAQTRVSQERQAGILFYNQGRTTEAISALRSAVKLDKTDGDAWYYLGLSLVRVDDMKAARKALSEAVKLKPEFAPAHTGFAYTLMAASKNEEAEHEARTAIQLNQADATAHYVLGVVHLRFLRNRDAESEANTAISQRPNFGPAYLLKSQALLALEGDESSRLAKVIRVGDRSQPTEKEKEERKARARRMREHFADAASALETYLKLVSSDSETATWRDQLETLRVYARQSPTTVYWGSDVTTKVRVLSKPEPSYTSQARSAGLAGTVILRAVFTAHGTVENILVVRSLPGGLTAESVQAARRIKFTPATKDGKPVSVFMELQYNFNLF